MPVKWQRALFVRTASPCSPVMSANPCSRVARARAYYGCRARARATRGSKGERRKQGKTEEHMRMPNGFFFPFTELPVAINSQFDVYNTYGTEKNEHLLSGVMGAQVIWEYV